jgi:hypothetical protein
MPRSDQPLSDRIQELEGEITGRVGQALAELRDSLRERLRAGEEEALRRLDEIVERIPRAVLSRQDVEPIALGAGAEGRREAWGDLLEGLAAIDSADGQAAALETLLAETRRYAARAVLFLTRAEGAVAWGASGWQGAVVAGTRVGWDEGDDWGRLAEGRGTVHLAGSDCALLCSRLESPLPAEGVLVPLVLRDRVAAALYADRLEDDEPLGVEALQLLTWATAAVIESQPFRSRSTTPTLHPADQPGAALPLWDAPLAPPAEEPAAAPVDLEIGDLDSVDLGAEAGYAAPGDREPADADLEPIDLEPVEIGEMEEMEEVEEVEEAEEAEEVEEPSDADQPAAAVVEAEVEAELAAAAAEAADEAELAAVEADAEVEEAIEEPAIEEPEPFAFASTQDVGTHVPEIEPPPLDPVWEPALEPEISDDFPAEMPEETPAEIEEPEELYGVAPEPPRFEEPADLEPPQRAWPMPTVAIDPGATQFIDRASLGPPTVPAPAPEPPPAEPEDEPGEVTTVGRPRGGAQVTPPEDVVGPGWAFARGPGSSGDDAVHEEARRLARLLVSEIRLYNEEQVEEGRRSHDIYSRLREDIDRSRQMYEERVDQSVLGGTDYFQEELVRILAAGDSEAMGMNG